MRESVILLWHMRTAALMPVTEIKRRATEIIAELEPDRPVLITQRGRSAAILLDVGSYDRMTARLALLEGIAHGERAILEGRVTSHAAARQRLSKWRQRR